MLATAMLLELLTCVEFHPAGRAVESPGLLVRHLAMLLELLAGLEVRATHRAAQALWCLLHHLNLLVAAMLC